MVNKFNRLVGLWCLTPLSTIFQLYRGGQCYLWRKPEDTEKTTDQRNTLYPIKIKHTNLLYFLLEIFHLPDYFS